MGLALQQRFEAQKEIRVRRIAHVLNTFYPDDLNRKARTATFCAPGHECRTYRVGCLVVMFWWGELGKSPSRLPSEINNWVEKTQDGNGLFDKFHEKNFARPVNNGPFEKDMDMGIAEDFMPAYIVSAIRVDKAEMPCHQQGISAPQVGGHVRKLEWLDTRKRGSMESTCYAVMDGSASMGSVHVTLVAKDSSSQEAEVPLPCLCKRLQVHILSPCQPGDTHLRLLSVSRWPEGTAGRPYFLIPRTGNDPTLTIMLFGMVGASVAEMHGKPILYAARKRVADRIVYGEAIQLGNCAI
ncbi:unnamed protein product, partial [Mesorhabditis spiculigera]